MERLSSTQVRLTSVERFARTRFNEMIDKGFSAHRAARRTEELFPGLDPDFYTWLSEADGRPISEWHEETWAYAVDILRETMEDAGFEVHVNGPAGTLTVIERSTSKALTIAPTSNTSHGTTVGVEALTRVVPDELLHHLDED